MAAARVHDDESEAVNSAAWLQASESEPCVDTDGAEQWLGAAQRVLQIGATKSARTVSTATVVGTILWNARFIVKLNATLSGAWRQLWDAADRYKAARKKKNSTTCKNS